MRVLPAIDLREGSCVQLVSGDPARERLRETDVSAVVDRFATAGFSRCHLVDLDAALGQGDNRAIVERLLERNEMSFQVGGGLRDQAAVAGMLELGAARVVVGTRAVTDPEWLEELCGSWPRRIVVAADVRGRAVQIAGWTAGHRLDLFALIERIGSLPLAGVLVTAVHREGTLAGPDLGLVSELVAASDLPIMASGGIATTDDLAAVARCGAAEVVVGTALYTGDVPLAETAKEYSK